jgi:hypothetical protein
MLSQIEAIERIRRMPRERQVELGKKYVVPEDVRSLGGEVNVRKRVASGEAVNSSWIEDYGDNPRDFIGLFLGAEWYESDWTAWRAFVAALFGQPLSPDELDLYQQCTQLDDHDGPYSEAWVPVGRRGGKSRILAYIAVYLAVCRDWRAYLAPGENGHIVVLAAQLKQAHAIMGYVKATLGDERLRGFVTRELSERIELDGDIVIEVVTASISAVRSRTVIAALCDEIAFWRADETSANPDVEILNALRPAMATIPNAMLLAASSPYARRGVLWENYHRYFGKPEGPLVWNADTRVMHPGVPQEFIDEEYEKDPVAAAAEYGGQFRSDVAAFVMREVVEAAVIAGRRELEPQPGVPYKAFVDPSGGSADSFTLAIAHRDRATRRGVLDCLREVRPPFSPEEVVQEFSTLLASYRIAAVTGDHYAGEWPREQFSKRGVRYELAEKRKSDIYQAWLPLLNSGIVELLDEPRLVAQTCQLERKVSRGGRDSIDHPPGGHDDVCNAAAGALVLVAARVPLVVSKAIVERSANPFPVHPLSQPVQSRDGAVAPELKTTPLAVSAELLRRSMDPGPWTNRGR